MNTTSNKTISIVEAARLIYRTKSPTEAQVYRVYECMKNGALRAHSHRGPLLQWTTTEQGLAEFLAAEMVKSQESRVSACADVQSSCATATVRSESWTVSTCRAEQTEHLRRVYRSIWREYFLAVMLRRRMVHRSTAFQRSVVAGQIVALTLLVVGAFGTVQTVVSNIVPQHKLIERWIDARTDEHEIERWHPVQREEDGGVTIRVEYRYTLDSNRSIHTDRTFRVVDDVVSEIPVEG